MYKKQGISDFNMTPRLRDMGLSALKKTGGPMGFHDERMGTSWLVPVLVGYSSTFDRVMYDLYIYTLSVLFALTDRDKL